MNIKFVLKLRRIFLYVPDTRCYLRDLLSKTLQQKQVEIAAY